MRLEDMERRLRYDDFDVSSEPELALIKARAELSQRINVLEDRIRPFVAARVSSTSAPPGRLLLDAGIIDKDMYATLGQALDATSPVAHGRSVSPSLASEVVSLTVSLADALDQLLSAVLQRVDALDANKRAAYRVLEMTTTDLRQLSEYLGTYEDGDESLERSQRASRVLGRVREKGLLGRLKERVL